MNSQPRVFIAGGHSIWRKYAVKAALCICWFLLICLTLLLICVPCLLQLSGKSDIGIPAGGGASQHSVQSTSGDPVALDPGLSLPDLSAFFPESSGLTDYLPLGDVWCNTPPISDSDSSPIAVPESPSTVLQQLLEGIECDELLLTPPGSCGYDSPAGSQSDIDIDLLLDPASPESATGFLFPEVSW